MMPEAEVTQFFRKIEAVILAWRRQLGHNRQPTRRELAQLRKQVKAIDDAR